jgi:kynureninase
MAVHLASLELFEAAGMERIGQKRDLMTAYLSFVVHEISSNTPGSEQFEIITPSDPKKRGAQLSIKATGKGRALFDSLTALGVTADWREPNVIRVAPAPLYNSFEDCYWFGQHLKSVLQG